MRIEAADYIEAAQERLSNARLLYEAAQYSFAMYAAGVAVESLLRAYVATVNPILETAHHLPLLLDASKLRQIVMETIMTRVQKVLQKEFSPREIRLKPTGRGKLSGWIISKSFDELTDEQRYQKVWKLLDANLSEKDRHRILGFFVFTPREEKWIFDGSSYDEFTALMEKSRAAKKQAVGKRTNGRARTMR